MPLTEAQYKALIPIEVGDDTAGTVATNIDLLWTKNDDKPDLFVRYLYTRRDSIMLLLGRVRQQVSFKALDGASVNLSDLTKNLQDLLTDTNRLLEEQAAILAGAVVAPLTTTAPIAPPPNWPNANDQQYKGDPYTPGRRMPGKLTP